MPRNWDEHFAHASDLDFTPTPLLVEVAEMVRPGRALDLACGPGRNSLYLAALGWRVVAVDSSPNALRILRQRAAGFSIEAHLADLEAGGFAIEPGGYDLICDFLYLQRNLFPQIREGVRPSGIVAAEVLLADGRPHRFALEAGELRAEFAGWKILYYSESPPPGHTHATARIIARLKLELMEPLKGEQAVKGEHTDAVRYFAPCTYITVGNGVTAAADRSPL